MDKNYFKEGFHTSLRKFCDSESSIGLWQWITFTGENKEYQEINQNFWEAAYTCFLENKDKEIDSSRMKTMIRRFSLVYEKDFHEKEQEERVPKLFVFTAGKGLFEGVVLSKDIESIFCALNEQIKTK